MTKRNLRNLARYAILLTLASLPLQATALDFTPDASRVVSDPSYLPLQGQIYGSSEYEYTRNTYDLSEPNNAGSSSHFRNTASEGTQTFSYGLTDDFTIRASESYEYTQGDRDFDSGGSTIEHSYGFTDPSFGATWRVLDQRTNAPLNWDIIGAYAPDFFKDKSASTTQDGTVGRGGQTATVGTALSYNTKAFTIYGEGSAEYLGDRDDDVQSNAETTHYDSSWQYRLDLNTQTRFTDQWSFNAGVSEVFNTDADASYVSGGTRNTFTSEPGDITELNTSLNYQVIPNRLVASLFYDHDFYQNNHSNYPVLTNFDSTTKNENEDVVGVELRYVFN